MDIFGLVFPSVRVHIVGVKVSTIDKSSIDGMGVSSAVVFKGWFSEVCGESTVGDPSGGLFKLNRLTITCSISFCCSF